MTNRVSTQKPNIGREPDPNLLSEGLRIRQEIAHQLERCAISGCDVLPTERLPDSMQLRERTWIFCKPHADLLARMIAKRDYDDFIDALRQQGIQQKPVLTDGQEMPERRRCCVPGCKGGVMTGIGFAPYKQPGLVWVCAGHQGAVNYVTRRLNGRQLVSELARQPKQQNDSDRLKRSRAIRAACAKHKKKPKYIENVCRDLQQQKVNMPQRWLGAWKQKGFRVEPCYWFDAYQNLAAKPTIQKHISRLGTLKVKPTGN